MYRLGRLKRHHRRLRRSVIAFALVAVIAVGIYAALHVRIHSKSEIHNAAAQSTTYSGVETKTMHFDTAQFSLDAPAGWQPFKATTDLVQPVASYRSNGEQIKMVSVYVDNIPSNLAVNRVVVVGSQGPSMTHGVISDNCTSFTNPTPSERDQGTAAGKWQGTNFLCDIGNYERDVVGITSPLGLNEIALVGEKTGSHKVFLSYTDNAINPDFSAFYTILESFRLK